MSDNRLTPDADAPAAAASPAGGMTLRGTVRRLGPVGVLALIAATLPAIGGFAVVGTMGKTAPWLEAHTPESFAVYIAVVAVMAGLALLPTYAQSIVAGAAFGVVRGTGAALAAIVGGAVIGFAIARRASGDRVTQLIAEQPKWNAVYKALLGGGFGRTLGIVTLLRVPPNSPFAITNLVLASTGVSWPIYLIGTLVGIAPRTAAAVFVGAGIMGEGSLALRIIGIAVTVVVVVLIGVIAQRAVARITGASADPRRATGEDDAP